VKNTKTGESVEYRQVTTKTKKRGGWGEMKNKKRFKEGLQSGTVLILPPTTVVFDRQR
jgi:hypothetical protein